MSTPTLMAEPRTVVGKKVKRLRAEGKVPAVVYGPAVNETVQVTVSEKDFTRFFSRHGHATLFDLECDGQSFQVFIRDVQLQPVRRNPVHIDFFAPNLLKAINTSVPLSLQDAPDGPGVFSQLLSEVVVHGLPTDIPHRFVVDCSVLKEIGDAIRVSELEAVEGIEIITGGEEMIAMLAAQAVEVEPEEAAVEGEAAAGEAVGAQDSAESAE